VNAVHINEMRVLKSEHCGTLGHPSQKLVVANALISVCFSNHARVRALPIVL